VGCVKGDGNKPPLLRSGEGYVSGGNVDFWQLHYETNLKEETALRGAELCIGSNQMLGEPGRQKGESLPSERLIF